MSTWLVTGGAGFIGSNFVRMACSRSGPRIVVLDALTYAGNLMNISDLLDDGRVDFVKGDICDEALVAAHFASHEIDCVVHVAAESHVDRSILGPRPFIRTNIEGTGVLLDAARRAWDGGQGRRVFLHVSTDEVFGSLGPDDPPFNESSPYRPGSPYAASKASSDHLAKAWAHTFGLPVIVSTHPRTRHHMERFGVAADNENVRFLEPFGLFDFVKLEKNAFCVLSDSGTVQEECCIFRIANVTIRDVTERPETVDCGSNMLSGVEPESVLRCVRAVLDRASAWQAPPEYLVEDVSSTVAQLVLGYHFGGRRR